MFTLQAMLENGKPHHRDSNQGPCAYRPGALTTALLCSSQPRPLAEVDGENTIAHNFVKELKLQVNLCHCHIEERES